MTAAPDALRVALLLASCLTLVWLEHRRPLFRLDGNAGRMATNLALTAVAVVVNVSATVLAMRATTSVGWPGLLAVFPVPGGLAVVASIVLLDFSAWAGHVAMHKSRLWQAHRLHHSDTAVDVTTALRQHPIETVWRVAAGLPAIVLLGITPTTVGLYAALSALFAQMEHANVRWEGRVERLVRRVFITPHMHKWHHSRDARETDTNYGNILSVWDRLFGTYSGATQMDRLVYGLD